MAVIRVTPSGWLQETTTTVTRVTPFGWVQETTGSASVSSSVPTGSLTLTGLAPTTQVGVSVSYIPTGTLTITGNELTSLVQGPTATQSDVPTGSLTLTGYPPSTNVYVATSYIPRGDLTLTGYEPTSVNVAISVVPIGDLTLTGYEPVTTVKVVRSLIPLAALVLTGYEPTTTGGISVVTTTRRGGIGRKKRRKIMYRGRIYDVANAAEESRLIQSFIVAEQAALEQAAEDSVQTVIKQRLGKLSKRQVNVRKEVERWLQAILDEDEEILLLLARRH